MIVTTTPWHGACRAAVAEQWLVMFVSIYMSCASFEHLREFGLKASVDMLTSARTL